MKKNITLLLLVLILLGAFIVRLYRIDNPLADWHSWRQVDTAAVSRNFITHGFDLLHPTYDDIANIQTGQNNPNGYRFVEFPIFNAFHAGLFTLFPFFSLEVWGRLVTILTSLLSITFLYLLAKKYYGKTAGLFTAFFYAFIPYNIYYGRVILPDPTMVMAVLGGIYFFDKAVEDKKSLNIKMFILSFLFTAAALLVKPFALFFLLPLLYSAWIAYGRKLFTKWYLWVFALGVVLPLAGWRIWMLQYPEGVPANTWLLNGNGIRFRPAFFRWIFYERLTRLIAGYFGLLFLFSGMLAFFQEKKKGIVLSFILSSLLYVTVIATGNVQHDYYQILVMPTVALVFGLGAAVLYTNKKRLFGISLGKTLVVLGIVGMLYSGWVVVKDYFNINNRAIITAGAAVDRLTPKDALIIAPYDGDTTLLYHTKRKGWPAFQADLPDLIVLGADYLLLLNPKEEHQEIGKQYKIVAETNEYLLFDLHKQP